MSTVQISELPKEQLEELMCVYAALVLHDDGQEISQENILKLVKAANGNIQPFLPMIFAKALKGKDISSLFGSVAAGAAPVAASGAVAASSSSAEAAAEAKAPEPEVEEEEDDMGFSLFD